MCGRKGTNEGEARPIMLKATVNRTHGALRSQRGRVACNATLHRSPPLFTPSHESQHGAENSVSTASSSVLKPLQQQQASEKWLSAAAMLGGSAASVLLLHAGAADAAVPMAQLAEIDVATAKLASDILRWDCQYRLLYLRYHTGYTPSVGPMANGPIDDAYESPNSI